MSRATGCFRRCAGAWALAVLVWPGGGGVARAQGLAAEQNPGLAQPNIAQPDIAQIESDLAAAGQSGTLTSLRKAWQVRFAGLSGAGEQVSLDVLPAIPVRAGDPEAAQRFARLRDQVRQAFDIRRQDLGGFTVVLLDGSKLLTSQGMVVPLRFEFRRELVTSAETRFGGHGQASCTIATQFFTTGTRQPLRLGENPTRARYLFSKEGVAVHDSYQGQHGEFVVFRRQSNEPVEVWLDYSDPELGQVTRFGPVSLQVCVNAALPPPPPPPVVLPEQAGPSVDLAPPPVLIEPTLSRPRRFTWGASGSLGLGAVAEPDAGTGSVGLGAGLSARVGYFVHPQVALLIEPRLSFFAGSDFLGFSASLAPLARLHFARFWAASLGPAIGIATTTRYGGDVSWAAGLVTRFGADVPLRRHGYGPERVVSLRLELAPLFLPISGAQGRQYTGSVLTFGLSVGYEHY